MLDNRYCILFIRGTRPVMDEKYELMEHPAIRYTMDGGGPPYIHHGTAEPPVRESRCSKLILTMKRRMLQHETRFE